MKVLLVFVVFAVVVATASALSACEKHRKEAIEHETIMKLIPECEDNGDYKAFQCFKDSDFCVCYDKHGDSASPILKTLKKCDCHLRRHEKIKLGLHDSYLPQCNPEGGFNKKQCWEKNGSCWCVDENNKQVGKIVADGDSLKCE